MSWCLIRGNLGRTSRVMYALRKSVGASTLLLRLRFSIFECCVANNADLIVECTLMVSASILNDFSVF
jgi:hypothetical protein